MDVIKAWMKIRDEMVDAMDRNTYYNTRRKGLEEAIDEVDKAMDRIRNIRAVVNIEEICAVCGRYICTDPDCESECCQSPLNNGECTHVSCCSRGGDDDSRS